MANKQNKSNLYIWIVVAVIVVVAIIVGVVIANNNKGGDGGDNGGSSSGASSSVPEYNHVDKTIMYGEFEEMEALSKAIQNGEMVGKIVKIDGLVSHPMSTYSVVQPNETGSQKIGTKFVITDVDEADYPNDGDRVVITGEIVEESPMVFVIRTYPRYVEVQKAN